MNSKLIYLKIRNIQIKIQAEVILLVVFLKLFEYYKLKL